MKSVSIVGAGILGLAHAYAYAKRGDKVRVFERTPKASGASVRNFGMLWPIGQPAGPLLDMALLSLRLWREVLDAAGLPYGAAGSLHLAYRDDEEAVAREFAERAPERARWLEARQVTEMCPAANPDGLRGGLFSPWETVVDPRVVLSKLPEYLEAAFGVRFSFGVAVSDPRQIQADRIVICSGDDFESLYPSVFCASGMTRCKLQMMRTAPQPPGWKLGPALAAGLTMRFYPSFGICESLDELRRRIADELAPYDRWGIHVMASQTADGAITLGDSHEFGPAVDVFNKEEIDRLILRYLAGFARFPVTDIAERWYGVYAKHPAKPYFVCEPEPGVRIVTGAGGSGMTLSFGLAETLCD